jgi:p-aminobenzoyl-glutamate transporter AbgT
LSYTHYLDNKLFEIAVLMESSQRYSHAQGTGSLLATVMPVSSSFSFHVLTQKLTFLKVEGMFR